MGQPYVGEIRLFAGNFAPLGWAFCDGSLLAIAENDVLFALIGTTYGGDGQVSFGLPDLRGRVPLHQGSGAGISVVIGELSGLETVQLSVAQIPAHTHALLADVQPGTHSRAAGRVMSASEEDRYAPADGTLMSTAAVTPTGGSQPHDNMMPYLAVNYIISLFGIFPTQ
jgi:microcystin-dependent protein